MILAIPKGRFDNLLNNTKINTNNNKILRCWANKFNNSIVIKFCCAFFMVQTCETV